MTLKIFTMPNCGECQAVKDFLRQQGADFIELDVTAGFANLRQLRRVTAGRRVPVTILAGDVVVGYDPAALTALLAKKGEFADDSDA